MKNEATMSGNVAPKAVMEPLGLVRRVFPISKKKKKKKQEDFETRLLELKSLLEELSGS